MILKSIISRTFSTLATGDVYQVQRVITQSMVDRFVELIGDENPIHREISPSSEIRVPGALLNGLVSGLIGSHFPGSGSLVVGQEYSFPNKCHIDQTIDFRLELVQNRKIMKIAYECQQNGLVVLTGHARIMRKN